MIRRSVVAVCLLLSLAGFVVMLVVDGDPGEPDRPYRIEVGMPGDGCTDNGSEASRSSTSTSGPGAGLHCGSGGGAGYFTQEEVSAITSAAGGLSWGGPTDGNEDYLLDLADRIALRKGFDAHPEAAPNAQFIDEVAQRSWVLFLTLAMALGIFTSRRKQT